MQPSTETASPLPGGAAHSGASSGEKDSEEKLKLQLAAQKEMENRLRKKEFGSKREGGEGGGGGVAAGDALAGEAGGSDAIIVSHWVNVFFFQPCYIGHTVQQATQ